MFSSVPEGAPVLTATQMRAAEERAIAAGSSVTDLMERAGTGVAEWVHRLAAGGEVLIVCGPGNNGGDGYVAARVLASRGMAVRVAASGEPKSAAAAAARAAWGGAVEALTDATAPAPLLVDALFGTGLARPVDPALAACAAQLARGARLRIAVDVPSGLDSDGGAAWDAVAACDVTLALGALKPAHVLLPEAAACGVVKRIDLALADDAPVRVLARPRLAPPGPLSHKFSRGMVAVIAGRMHGAGELAARAAYRAGAGYVLLMTGGMAHPPHAIVRRGWDAAALDDARIGAVVIGPGLGRDDRAREKLGAALASDRPLVIDGDALHLLDLSVLRGRAAPVILTPHAGEFEALFGTGPGNKIARTQDAARRADAVVVFKGADTVIAAPDGRADVAPMGSPWLSVAGTGDVLAGAIAAMLAWGQAPFDASGAGVWLHGMAAQLRDRCFLADELADALAHAYERAR